MLLTDAFDRCLGQQHVASLDFFETPLKRQKYRDCLVEKNFEAALNYLYPIQDILEELEIVCADHLGKYL